MYGNENNRSIGAASGLACQQVSQPISQQITYLRNAVTELAELMGDVQARLSPALSQSEVEGNAVSAPEPDFGESEIERLVAEERSRVKAIISSTRALYSRIRT